MKKKIYKFEDLIGLKSNSGYKLNVNKLGGDYISASITKDDEHYYLSTHTFYGGHSTRYAQKKLDECGFDIELIDYETQKELSVGIYSKEEDK